MATKPRKPANPEPMPEGASLPVAPDRPIEPDVVSDIRRLDLALALPLLPADGKPATPLFMFGSIERFAAPSGEQFEIVVNEGALHRAPINPEA